MKNPFGAGCGARTRACRVHTRVNTSWKRLLASVGMSADAALDECVRHGSSRSVTHTRRYATSVGCMVCHLVAFSYVIATRNGAPSSYSFPVKTIPCGRPLTNPHGVQACGWPVRLVTNNRFVNAGDTRTSQSAMN